MNGRLYTILATIINKINEIKAQIVTLTSNVAKTDKRALLWTNANPSSAFSTQTIVVDTSYDAYEIEYIGYNIPDQLGCHMNIRMDATEAPLTYIAGGNGFTSGNLFIGKRMATRVATGIEFGKIYSVFLPNNVAWTEYTANTVCIPYKIYGINYGITPTP